MRCVFGLRFGLCPHHCGLHLGSTRRRPHHHFGGNSRIRTAYPEVRSYASRALEGAMQDFLAVLRGTARSALRDGSGRGGVDLRRWSPACAQDDGLLRRLRCGKRRRDSRSWVARGLVDGTASVYFGWNMTRAYVVRDCDLQHNILLLSLPPRSIVRSHGSGLETWTKDYRRGSRMES